MEAAPSVPACGLADGLSQYSRPSSPGIDSDGTDDSNSSYSIHDELQSGIRNIEMHVSSLKAIQQGDFSNEEATLALPRRNTKSQRSLLIQLAKIMYPDLTEIAAIIKYESLVTLGKSTVRKQMKSRNAPKSQRVLLNIQGPWAGQAMDPVDLNGPAAIPMPVEIGKTEDFAPIFAFIANESFHSASQAEFKPNLNFLKKNEQYTGDVPLLEFPRGIIYEDGRLDLCKKVVGPTHIGNLMESLESNHEIRHFLLGNNAISTTGAKRIAEFIQKHPGRMETWYLAGCHITQHGLSLLVPQMVTSSTITNLWFKRNPLGPTSATLLADLVLQTLHLRTLDLETTQLGDEGVHDFIDKITGHPSSLRNLYLNANGVGERACASLGNYLADPHCKLESLFLSTNPIGDAGIFLLTPGIASNKTLKRLMLASCGLTGKGISQLASAISPAHPPHAIDLGASQTTKAHGQKFNYFDNASVDGLKLLINKPSLRWLDIGGTLMSEHSVQEIRTAVATSELVYFHMHVHRLEAGGTVPKSCSLEIRKQLVKNQAKYFPQYKTYEEFLSSDEFRFLRNTSDVRKIDSMYRTQDKRLGLPMDTPWAAGDLTWKLITDDARMAEMEASGH